MNDATPNLGCAWEARAGADDLVTHGCHDVSREGATPLSRHLSRGCDKPLTCNSLPQPPPPPRPAVTVAEEVAAVRAELTRLDAKCGTLTGLAGAAVAFLATQVGGDAPIAQRALLAAAGLVLTAATVLLLSGVLRPKLGPTGFRFWAALPPEEIAAEIAARDDLGPSELHVLSKICNTKNIRLRLAVDLIVVAVGLIGVGLVAGVTG